MSEISLDRPCRADSSRLWVFCRIDYHLASPALAEKARAAAIYKDVKFSDHAPLTIDYDFAL